MASSSDIKKYLSEIPPMRYAIAGLVIIGVVLFMMFEGPFVLYTPSVIVGFIGMIITIIGWHLAVSKKAAVQVQQFIPEFNPDQNRIAGNKLLRGGIALTGIACLAWFALSGAKVNLNQAVVFSPLRLLLPFVFILGLMRIVHGLFLRRSVSPQKPGKEIPVWLVVFLIMIGVYLFFILFKVLL